MNQRTSSCSMDAFISIIPPDQEEKNSKKKHVICVEEKNSKKKHVICAEEKNSKKKHVICAEEKNSKKKHAYSKEFQAILDGLEEEDRLLEEYGTQANDHKKKRLSTVQVKALEKIFEVENKVEAERKVQLAEELGLQPRQVAVWFQNRRARSKNKQLEKDYAVLKANYDALKLDYDNLEHENHALTEKLRDLKAKQSKDNDDDGDGDGSFGIGKEEISNMNAGLLMSSPPSCSFQFNGSSSSTDSSNHQWGNMHEPQLVKVEEQCMFSTAEECCNFFSVDQPPTLQWHFTGQP